MSKYGKAIVERAVEGSGGVAYIELRDFDDYDSTAQWLDLEETERAGRALLEIAKAERERREKADVEARRTRLANASKTAGAIAVPDKSGKASFVSIGDFGWVEIKQRTVGSTARVYVVHELVSMGYDVVAE